MLLQSCRRQQSDLPMRGVNCIYISSIFDLAINWRASGSPQFKELSGIRRLTAGNNQPKIVITDLSGMNVLFNLDTPTAEVVKYR